MENFIPNVDENLVDVPYFEDARNSDGVVGYATRKTVAELEQLVRVGFGKLGGSVNKFQFGKSLDGKRHAIRVHFTFKGVPGRMDMFGLPLKNNTKGKIDIVKRHILYSLWKRVESEFSTLMLMPGDVPLVPYMLNANGQTMLEFMRESGEVPALPAPEENIYEGEFEE